MAGTIVVCGATGRQGGAVSRALLERGRSVRALTRKPDGRSAKDLADVGADVVGADMDDPATLLRAFEGADGVYSVQNGIASGFERETAQGRNVADAAKAADVRVLVYASAGPGGPTGVPSWDSKIPVEAHIESLGIPATILRPLAFMELMTDRSFYPSVGTWRIFPRLTGEQRPIPWLSVVDLGLVAASLFENPDRFIGRELTLTSDALSIAECRSIYRDVMGADPRTVPMPIWLFDRFTRRDPSTMWRWLRTGEVSLDTAATRELVPSALTVREWLVRKRVERAA